MVRVYSAAEVHAALPWGPLADALQAAFLRGAQVPLRHAHTLAPTDTLLLMPAWSARALGVTKFGQSGYRNDLYRYFHLDTESIIAAGFGLCDGA